MEIELPNGLVLEAPDGADPKTIVANYRAKERERLSELYRNEDKLLYNPTSGMSGGQKFRAGIGSGMMKMARGATNLALPESITPEWASTETIREAKNLDKPLGDTGAGAAGQLIGEVASTLPLGVATGAALKGAQMLRAAPRTASVLTRALGNPAGRAALEGAASGAIAADPEERGSGAATGAALGATMAKLAQGGGRIIRGLVKKSDAAQDLAQLASQHGEDIFVPISQAADEGDLISRVAKTTYKEALPIIPGVKGKLQRQGAAAAEKLREISVREALPPGMALPKSAGNKVLEATGAIQRGFDQAYDDTIKSYAFNVPGNFKDEVARKVAASAGKNSKVNSQTVEKVSGMVDDIMKQFSDGQKTIDGTNLLNVKRGISEMMKFAKGHEKGPLQAADEMIDDLIVTELKQGGSAANVADLKKYLELTPAYRAFKPVKSAAESAVPSEGRFLFRTLAQRAKRSPEQRLIGQLGAQTVDMPAATGTLTGKILANLGMMGAGFGAFMAPLAVAGTMAGGQVLASKPVQRGLMGDLATQKVMAELLRRNPELMRMAGSGVRGAITAETVE